MSYEKYKVTTITVDTEATSLERRLNAQAEKGFVVKLNVEVIRGRSLLILERSIEEPKTSTGPK